MNPIKIGIAGLGRSGWNIHAKSLQELTDHFTIAAAMDLDAARRDEANRLCGAKTTDNFTDLISDSEIEVVIVATPNFLHKDHVIAALEAGKHVVCEKPFGLSSAEADEMISVARRVGKHVVPFQNRRFEPHFQKVKEIVDSGILGEIQLVRICQHGFTRRWDWQTLREFGGGQLLNTGPHIVDHALELLGGEETPEVWAELRNVHSSGDAEDHFKIVLRSPNRADKAPMVEIELSMCCAFPQDRWLVMGKNGGLRGTTGELEWKWVDWSQLPERPVERVPTVGREYNREELPWQSNRAKCSGDFPALCDRFYRELYAALREAAPLPIRPESVRRQIAVIERAKELTGY